MLLRSIALLVVVTLTGEAHALSVNAPPPLVELGPTNRPTRRPGASRLFSAAERARRFKMKSLGQARVVGDAPIAPQLGRELIDEQIRNVTIEIDGQRRHVIDQDLVYRVAAGSGKAFKRGFLRTGRNAVGPRFDVVAVEKNGKWVAKRERDPWASGGRFIVRARGARIGTDLPGVAPATAYLLVDPASLIEHEHETSFEIQFLNPWDHRGSWPPYVDAIGRYGVRDHGNGTATMFAYWQGDAGHEMVEPTLRETTVGKTLKSGWDFGKRLTSSLPLVGGLGLSLANLTERTALATARVGASIGDMALVSTGLYETLFPIAAKQHVRFYERDFLNPERWAR